LEKDIAETTDVAASNPEVVRELTKFAEEARKDLGDFRRPGRNQRPVGFVADPKPQVK